eukprot:scaffold272598_cov30-Tisochrysis_lutea.AAC.3
MAACTSGASCFSKTRRAATRLLGARAPQLAHESIAALSHTIAAARLVCGSGYAAAGMRLQTPSAAWGLFHEDRRVRRGCALRPLETQHPPCMRPPHLQQETSTLEDVGGPQI